MIKRTFHGVDVNGILKITGKKGYGVSLAVAGGDGIETCCGEQKIHCQNPDRP